MNNYIIDGKKITVYPCSADDRPILYFITSDDDAYEVRQMLKRLKCPDMTLVTVCGVDWNSELSPWASPAVFKNGQAFDGGADRFLTLLTGSIIPAVESDIQLRFSHRGIVGYSLAGLFAVYSLFKTDAFLTAASISGSLWFPQFKEFVLSHDMFVRPERVYFSLGDKECRTANPFIRSVQDATSEIYEHFRKKEIATVFELKPGNHYSNFVQRCADGIMWLLSTHADANDHISSDMM